MTTHGHCHCAAVTSSSEAEPTAPVACHCGQCRRQSGHYRCASHLPEDGLVIAGRVTWFKSSPGASRGFCGASGSVLFRRAEGEGMVPVSSGSLDAPSGLRLARHIFTSDAGDYHAIADGLPRS